MNNDLEQFSEERLMQITQQPDSSTIFMYEVRQLARIALSAKQAKPVGFIEFVRLNNPSIQKIPAWDLFENGRYVDPVTQWWFELYTTPQPANTEVNYPVIPDGWKLVPVTPTDKMLLNAMISGEIDSILPAISRAESMWEQFLAAAPKPESE